MFSLILVTTFTPFLWGSSHTSSVEIQGFESISHCVEAANKFRDYRDSEGKTSFYTKCIDKGSSK